MSPNFHINDFGTPISPPTAVINNIYISVNIEKIKIFLGCWKEMMEIFFQSSIDTRGGVLSLKINIVITFKQGRDFKPGLLYN